MNRIKITSLILCAFLGVASMFCVLGHFAYNQIMFPLKFRSEIVVHATINNLSCAFVAGVICAESRFRADVVSNSGALGLMQLMPSTAIWLANRADDSAFAVEDLLKPEVNVKYGCLYLRYLLDKFKDENTTLASYNAGEGNVIKWLSDARYSPDGRTLTTTPFTATNFYVEKVIKCAKVYEKKF